MKTRGFQQVHTKAHRTTIKGQVDKTRSQLEFNNGGSDNKEQYTVETSCESRVYTRKSDNNLLDLYQLVSWKSYLEEKKYLETSISRPTPLEIAEYLPQGRNRKTDSNLIINRFHSTNSYAYSQPSNQAKARPIAKDHKQTSRKNLA